MFPLIHASDPSTRSVKYAEKGIFATDVSIPLSDRSAFMHAQRTNSVTQEQRELIRHG
jgi:hypothetical protein